MLYVYGNVAERDVYTDPPMVITVAAATPKEVLPDEQLKGTGEISLRLIQNTGANTLYYAENTSDSGGNPMCDGTNAYHGMLLAGQQLDCSTHRQRVCVWSQAGTTVSVTVRRRRQQGKMTILNMNQGGV